MFKKFKSPFEKTEHPVENVDLASGTLECFAETRATGNRGGMLLTCRR